MAKGVTEQIIESQAWLDDVAEVVQPPINAAFEAGGEAGRVAKDFLHGVWLGHPLHPVLTDIPIGAWTMAQVFDVASIAQGGDKSLDQAADIALGVGIVAAVGAATTGIADWSEARQAGTLRRMGLAHGLLNAAGLTLNIVSLLMRQKNSGGQRRVARAFSAAGYLTSATAAYVAGELVYNHGMAVSRNAFVEEQEHFRDVADVRELDDGKMRSYDVGDTRVALVKHEDGIHAFGAVCSHMGCDLAEGDLDGHTVTCNCHGSQFDIRDGSLIHGPATDPVPGFDVKTQIGRVLVRVRD